MKYYKCGHIMTTHGLKGALKIKDLSDFDRFYKDSTLYILYKNANKIHSVIKTDSQIRLESKSQL